MIDINAFLKNVTTQPGVYKMLGEGGEVLYVGKARNLKKRLNSYFHKSHEDIKTQALVKKIFQVEVMITKNETEALLLENNLIKQYKPRFNVLLRDDKSYPYLFLSTQHPFPRLDFYRGAQKLPGRYFGPYPSTQAVRENLLLLQKIFKLRNCSHSFFENRSRPCLQYQIERCTGPCVGLISQDEYAIDVKHVLLFLEGKGQSILLDLVKRMEDASEKLDFEAAARFRNQLASLRKLQEQQHVMNVRDKNVDVVVVAQAHAEIALQVLMVRNNRVLGNKTYFPKTPADTGSEEVLEAFLNQHYVNLNGYVPSVIIVNERLKNKKNIVEVLSDYAQHRVAISDKVRGGRASLLEIALRNVKQALTLQLADKNNAYQRFLSFQQALNLLDMPKKIACFDVSHTRGEETVASYVVFTQEGAAKSEYRRYNIEGVTPGDDYAAMHQVMMRRFGQMSPELRPDVVLIDGGLGQLHQAEKVCHTLNIHDVLLIGVAKGRERKSGKETLWLSGQDSPLELASTSLAFHLMQQVRDESHRFAITGHRMRREKKRLHSELEQIPGVGAKRRKALLNYFGGWQEVKKANREELLKVPGMSHALVEKILAYFES
ncbi:MAG: excinuclease ABC subunit UvrC [Gammaproteobacteria bacterium]|nr:excinuclease ABC subunit UvrC [Gammaproteobacteria bacterium]